MSAPHPFLPGARLGRFRLDRVLGQGAYGIVWLAVDEGGFGFQRRVALKILSERGDAQRQQALLREARICGALHHPGLISVSGVGRIGEYPYLIMEYVEGETLSALWKDLRAVGVRFPRSVILEIGITVADALHHAWTAPDESGRPLNLVHRDLKPANVLLSDRGQAKIADFGIAKVAPDLRQTRIGRLKGTPAYMSPELWMGTRDFRPGIDLWSLGVVLWELATGRRFYGTASMAEIPELIRTRDPREEAEEVEGYFPALVPVLERLLNRRIDERPATGLELAAQLRRVRAEVGVTGDLVQFMRVVRAGRLAPADRDRSLDILPSMPYVADDWLPLIGLAAAEPDEPTGERGRLDDLQDYRPLRFSLTQAQGPGGRDVEAPTLLDIPAPGGVTAARPDATDTEDDSDAWAAASASLHADGGAPRPFDGEDSEPELPPGPITLDKPPELPPWRPTVGLPERVGPEGRLSLYAFGMRSRPALPARAPDPEAGGTRDFVASDSFLEPARLADEPEPRPAGVFRAADIECFEQPSDGPDESPGRWASLDLPADPRVQLAAMETRELAAVDDPAVDGVAMVDASRKAVGADVRRAGRLWVGLTTVFLLVAAAGWLAAGAFV